MSTISLFSVLSAGLRFVEIQKLWQPRQRGVTTSLYCRLTNDASPIRPSNSYICMKALIHQYISSKLNPPEHTVLST